MFPKPWLPAVRQEAEEMRASEQAHSEAAEQPHVSFRMAEQSRKRAQQEAKARTQEGVHLAGLLRQPVAAQKLRPALEPRLA